jgi:Transglycosylase SLT domain/SPOR domain
MLATAVAGAVAFIVTIQPGVQAKAPQAVHVVEQVAPHVVEQVKSWAGLVAARARVKLTKANLTRVYKTTVAAVTGDDADDEPAPRTEVSIQTVCGAVQAAAAANDLPVDFFTRLIWQESRFDPQAVSRAGAQGIAQFMPGTAAWRGLADPFNPVEALHESAQFLRELRSQFGNLGLAAAAYNAGPRRVQEWLAKRGALPRETQGYVRIITGREAEDWTSSEKGMLATRVPAVPCPEIAKVLVEARAQAIETRKREARAQAAEAAEGKWAPWGVQLAGDVSETKALAEYARLKKKFALLRDRSPIVVKSRVPGRGTATRHLVRLAAQSRDSAEQLCGKLKAAGASCAVMRNPQPMLAGR